MFLPLCPQPLLVPFMERKYLNTVKQNVHSACVGTCAQGGGSGARLGPRGTQCSAAWAPLGLRPLTPRRVLAATGGRGPLQGTQVPPQAPRRGCGSLWCVVLGWVGSLQTWGALQKGSRFPWRWKCSFALMLPVASLMLFQVENIINVLRKRISRYFAPNLLKERKVSLPESALPLQRCPAWGSPAGLRGLQTPGSAVGHAVPEHGAGHARVFTKVCYRFWRLTGGGAQSSPAGGWKPPDPPGFH